MKKIKEIIANLSIEEKVALTTGIDNWQTKAFEQYDVPSLVMSDGPHGMRKEQVDENNKNIFNSVPATCFPTASLLACSFDKDLAKLMGEALGEESIEQNVDVVLGPGINIKRSPLCGRNFEYFSEDPLLSGELGAAYINGVQSKGVGTSVKHFFANSQEYRRVTSSSEVDERTLREMYLTNFEIAVKKGKPWTVMAAYNKINGVFATENTAYNEHVLYGEWGFDGSIVSDWGATHDRVKALQGGTALTMPSDKEHHAQIVEAVKKDKDLEKVLDINCKRLLELAQKAKLKKKNQEKIHDSMEVAQKIVEESLVLLKNEEVLPLRRDQKVTFIGQFAKEPRYQGSGSSRVNSINLIPAKVAAEDYPNVDFCQGYLEDDEKSEPLLKEAVSAAKTSDVAVLFVGLPESFESEGYDRPHMKLPDSHNELIKAVAEVNSRTIVVLHNGAPVEMPWADDVEAIIETYLGGDAVGKGVVNVLFGETNPSGRLAESFPYKLEDNPSYLFYKGERDIVEYREGVFVGYRYYETKKADVRYPFGYGLSYTNFEYSNLSVEKEADSEIVNVSVKVTNTGQREGKEVVQLYVSPHKGVIIRPTKELKAFDKLSLLPNETKEVKFSLDNRAFSYWSLENNDWAIETGKYDIIIGKNSRDDILFETIELAGNEQGDMELTELSTIGDLINNSKGQAYWNEISPRFFEAVVASGFAEETNDTEPVSAEQLKDQKDAEMYSVLMSLPISTLSQMIPGYGISKLKEDLDKINKDDWRLY